MITFHVAGIPQPQGSKAVNRSTGNMYEDNKKVMPWRQDVIGQAVKAHAGTPILGPVTIDMKFCFPRLKGHFGSGRNAAFLKDSAPLHHAVKPDCDKCVKAVFDALTIAGVWRDDAQVWRHSASKVYGSSPGVDIIITTLEDDLLLEPKEVALNEQRVLL